MLVDISKASIAVNKQKLTYNNSSQTQVNQIVLGKMQPKGINTALSG
jgi:hypothetical protein